jgi:hypothetical protein
LRLTVEKRKERGEIKNIGDIKNKKERTNSWGTPELIDYNRNLGQEKNNRRNKKKKGGGGGGGFPGAKNSF